MGLFDDELTLPGVSTDIVPTVNDNTITEIGTTDSVTVIGTAFNGPVGEPIQVANPEMAKYIFGDSYDAATKRTATLVSEIQDAYDRGCRNLYAVRVSGQEMYKDFNLAVETDLKLRVSGYFPHNGNKKCFMSFQIGNDMNKAFGKDEGVIRIYKPADRTVISEKNTGVVDSINNMLVNTIYLANMGYSRSSRLCDVVDLINRQETNNVLKLQFVDAQGIVKTNADKAVQEIPVCAMFPGIYTICRDGMGNGIVPKTDVKFAKGQMFKGDEILLHKELAVNTDPSKAYPLFCAAGSENDVFKLNTTKTIYEAIRDAGVIDTIAKMNDDDYEEVDLSGLELYKRLGTGYLQTACLQEVKDGLYKVVVAPDGDDKKIETVEDGVYSKLEMHETDYTVLAAATAETEITGKLPKRNAFRKAKTKPADLQFGGDGAKIQITAKVDAADVDLVKEIFAVEIGGALELTTDEIVAGLKNGIVYRVPAVDEDPDIKRLKRGQLVLVGKELKKVSDTGLVKAEIGANDLLLIDKEGARKVVDAKGDAATITEDYFIGMAGNQANVYKKEDLMPIMSAKDLIDRKLDVEDYILVAKEEVPHLGEIETDNKGVLVIAATCMEYAILSELIEEIKADTRLKDFVLAIPDADDGLTDCSDKVGQKITGELTNKEDDYDYDTELHIAFTSTDNFARHLAQHCLYATLRAYPTHGVIGCDTLTGVTLSTVTERVNQITDLELDMYAKKPNGNNVLNNNNTPYPIGRCVSIVFSQYAVGTGSGYDYISSGAAGYAGMLSTLDAEVSSTNQEIDLGDTELSFNLSAYQLSKLDAKGIVCFRDLGTKIVVVDGITQAPANSPYRRLSTIKAINITAKLLREAVLPFIGKPQTLANMNSLETAIKSVLKNITGYLINSSDFTVSTDEDSNDLGIVKIAYTIVPAREIKQVRNSITVK